MCCSRRPQRAGDNECVRRACIDAGPADGNLDAAARLLDGCGKQVGDRQATALRLGSFQREHPARDRCRHRERRQRPARRNAIMAGIAIVRERRACAGGTRRHQGSHLPRRLVHDPESVAAKMVHVRIDNRNHRRHRHHGFERVAAFGQHLTPGFGGGEMRRADDAAAVTGCVAVHQIKAPCPASTLVLAPGDRVVCRGEATKGYQSQRVNAGNR
jgi:hypothetical protein